MTDILQRLLVPSPDAATSPAGDETVILDMRSGLYFGLDAVGTAIWEFLKEGHTPTAICELLAQTYEIDRATAEADVRAFLVELESRGLIIDG